MGRLRMTTVGFHRASIPPRMEKAKPLDRKPFHGVRWLHLTLVVLLLAVLAACKRDTPEAALRAQLAQMQAAASERRVGDFMDGVATAFAGSGGMDRAALHNLLRLQMLRNSEVGVTSGPVQIEMQGDNATVRMNVVLTGGNGRLLPDSAQIYAITSGWRMEAGQWRVYYAAWESSP